MTKQTTQNNTGSQKLYAPIPLNRYQQNLLTEIKASVAKERESTLAVVQLLRRIEAEKIYAILGYSSLWEFTVKELGYSPDSAFRRISAMRLIRELPQAKEKIEKGTLSLTAAAQLQKFIRAQKQSPMHMGAPTQGGESHRSDLAPDRNADQSSTLTSGFAGHSGPSANSTPALTYANQVDLLNKVEGKSTREVEQILLAESEIRSSGLLPSIKIKCTEKPIHSNWTDVTVTLDNKTLQKLKEIQDALSNTLISANQGAVNLATAIEKIIHDTHEKLQKKLNKKLPEKSNDKSYDQSKTEKKGTIVAAKVPTENHATTQQANCLEETPSLAPVISPMQNRLKTANNMETTNAPSLSLLAHKVTKRQSISRSMKMMIFQKYQTQCQYAGCQSRAFLQIDHKIPLSAGGSNSLENLTLLCATHNRLKGQKNWLKCG